MAKKAAKKDTNHGTHLALVEDYSELSQDYINTQFKMLYRVIYLTDWTPRYIAGDPESFFLKDFVINLTLVTKILSKKENLEKFLDILKKANNDENLPRRITLFYVLAFALRNHSSDLQITSQLADTILEVCSTDEEFFRFINIFARMKGRGRDLKQEEAYNKITTSMGRIIRKFFEKKTPKQFAKDVAKTKGYHGWQYKDLIKLSHYKSETAEKLLVTEYVLYGSKGLKEPESEDVKPIYNFLQEWTTLGKPQTSVEKICKLVVELKPGYRSINPKYIENQEVWGALIPNLPVGEVMQLLPFFLRHKMLQPIETSIVYGKVKGVFTVPNVRSQKVNPLEIFIHLKNFEKGGKAIDPKLEVYLKSKKLEVKTPARIPADNVIAKMLYKCMHHSYPLDPTLLGLNRRVMLAIDVTDTDSVCFKQRNITCLEAQVALAMYYSNIEKNIDITVFDGEEIKIFKLDKGSFEKNLNKLKEIKSKKGNPKLLFDWAVDNKKKFDVFIYLLQNVKTWHVPPKEFRGCFAEGLKHYQDSELGSNPKIVVICLGSRRLAPLEEHCHSLTICGFCPEIPKVINSFVKGKVQSISKFQLNIVNKHLSNLRE